MCVCVWFFLLTVNPKEKFEIYASDLHTAHTDAGRDCLDCPYLAPEGQRAKDIYPELAESSGSAAADAVMADLEEAVNGLENIPRLAADKNTTAGLDETHLDEFTDSSDPDLSVITTPAASAAGASRVSSIGNELTEEKKKGLMQLADALTVDTTAAAVGQICKAAGIEQATICAWTENIEAPFDKLAETMDKALSPIFGNMPGFDTFIKKCAEAVDELRFSKSCAAGSAFGADASQEQLNARLDQAEKALEADRASLKTPLEAPPQASARAMPQTLNEALGVVQQMQADHDIHRENMEVAIANMHTMQGDHKSMQADHQKEKKALEATLRDVRKELHHAKQEAKHNETRVHRMAAAVKEHYTGKQQLNTASVKEPMDQPSRVKKPQQTKKNKPKKADKQIV